MLPDANSLTTKETLKQYLRGNGLVYQAAEALYENALYVPIAVRQHLLGAVGALRTGRYRGPAGQSVMRWDVPFPAFRRPCDLTAWLRSQGVEVREGGHTIYVPPQAALRDLLPSIVDFYPDHSGFKILKDLRSPRRARYIYKHPKSLRTLRAIVGAPREQLVAANYMYWLGIGPRVWDVCCWSSSDTRATVFVVDHVSGRPPTVEQCTEFLAHLEDLSARTHLRMLAPRWRQSMDFKPPDCNHNLFYCDTLRRAQYVDFQNFGLTHRGAWWHETAASDNGSDAPPSAAGAIRAAAADLHGRLVVDAACGDGTRLYAALAGGAAWALGWDRAELVSRATARLLSHGAARFTVIAAVRDDPRGLPDDVPRHLQALLPNAVMLTQAGEVRPLEG